MVIQDIMCFTCKTESAMFVCMCQPEPIFICINCFSDHKKTHKTQISDPVSLSRLKNSSEEEQLSSYGEYLSSRVEICSSLLRYKETVKDLYVRLQDSRNQIMIRLAQVYAEASGRYENILKSVQKCYEELQECSANRKTEKLKEYYNEFMNNKLRGLGVEYWENIEFNDQDVIQAIDRMVYFDGDRTLSYQDMERDMQELNRRCKTIQEEKDRLWEQVSRCQDTARVIQEKDLMISELNIRLESLSKEKDELLKTQQAEVTQSIQQLTHQLQQKDSQIALQSQQINSQVLQIQVYQDSLETYTNLESTYYQFLFKSPLLYIPKLNSSTLIQYDCFTNNRLSLHLNTDFVFTITTTCILPKGDVFISGSTDPNCRRAFIFKAGYATLLELEQMKVARYGHSVVWYRDWVYVFGGRNVNKAERLSLESMQWEMIKGNMLECRCYFSVVALNEKIYLIGGENCDSIEMLDVKSLTFISLNVKIDRGMTVASVVNDQIHILTKNMSYVMDKEMNIESQHELSNEKTRFSLCNVYSRGDCMIYFNSQSEEQRIEYVELASRKFKYGMKLY